MLGLSPWGLVGAGLLAVHVVLLLFPPIPPLVFHPKDSLWSYLLAYGTMFVLAVEIRRQRARIIRWWTTIGPSRQVTAGAFALLAAAGAMAIVRAFAPSTFDRFSSEAGIWEPVSLLCYLGAALILWPADHLTDRAYRRHWQLIAVLYVILALEEVDYFSVFGGRIGRIQGVYVGSLHDLIALATKGGLHPGAAAAIGAFGLAAAVGLWRTGYLQPRRLTAMLRGAGAEWLTAGILFLAVAALHEVHLVFRNATGLEEPLDFLGAICLAVYALQLTDAEQRLVTDRGGAP